METMVLLWNRGSSSYARVKLDVEGWSLDRDKKPTRLMK